MSHQIYRPHCWVLTGNLRAGRLYTERGRPTDRATRQDEFRASFQGQCATGARSAEAPSCHPRQGVSVP